MNKKTKKTTKNLYDFDYESKKEKKIKKKKADKKSASKAEQSGQAEKKKKYEELIENMGIRIRTLETKIKNNENNINYIKLMIKKGRLLC